MVRHSRYYLSRFRQLPYGAFRRVIRRRCPVCSAIEPFFTKKYGLEIGGPSQIFSRNGLIPVYDCCSAIDSCDYASETIWSVRADSASGAVARGKRYVADACDLSAVHDRVYDFVLASHVFEHLANPMRAVHECNRVLATGGVLLIVVPDKRVTFDRRRPFTSFEHLESDFHANTTEDDLTHLEEILSLHDLGLDPWAGSQHEFRERCLRNATIRAMHHHVFSAETLTLMFSYVGMRVLILDIERPFHIIALAQKADPVDRQNVRRHNVGFLDEGADWRRHDPFRRLSPCHQATAVRR